MPRCKYENAVINNNENMSRRGPASLVPERTAFSNMIVVLGEEMNTFLKEIFENINSGRKWIKVLKACK